MELRRLHLVNFRQHADTELEFGPGITGIIGPNGSGKTTILEAIAWAIYGLQAVRGDKDSIRRLGAKGRATVEVELEFHLGTHEYPRDARPHDRSPLSGRTADRELAQGRDGHARAAARHEPRRVLQHVLHRAEGARA